MALSPWQPLSGRRVRRISRSNERADVSGAGAVLKVCTINVGTPAGRGRELVAMLTKKKRFTCVVFRKYDTETRVVQPLVEAMISITCGTVEGKRRRMELENW